MAAQEKPEQNPEKIATPVTANQTAPAEPSAKEKMQKLIEKAETSRQIYWPIVKAKILMVSTQLIQMSTVIIKKIFEKTKQAFSQLVIFIKEKINARKKP